MNRERGADAGPLLFSCICRKNCNCRIAWMKLHMQDNLHGAGVFYKFCKFSFILGQGGNYQTTAPKNPLPPYPPTPIHLPYPPFANAHSPPTPYPPILFSLFPYTVSSTPLVSLSPYTSHTIFVYYCPSQSSSRILGKLRRYPYRQTLPSI